ncbi:hypothetical protein CAOG_03966 [Capsaspora owczarzaki ATCC 30864]|uniref:hypothetical protein n=1 Tax=Capsaspora owczarzaki (strain ATCC 30864) TaxID=595528 RepID=UPI000352106E|nr:hypothetical protein CAOG_03966 [Capsaspora owczarzaki ATCC 30864]|eukprot:XP_004347791.2 hypothetical protein CAOG_03966 [Capsaspora owczarzaki ATCC 30864]
MSLKSGYLTKQGGSVKSWKRRWFVLQPAGLTTPASLQYFKTDRAALQANAEALGTISLADVAEVRKADADPEVAGKRFAIACVTPSRTYWLVADSESEMNDWLSILTETLAATAAQSPSSLSQPAGVASILAAPIVHEGYLTKQGGSVKTWKKRWFVLRGNAILYYRTQDAKTPLGIINLAASIGTAEISIPGHQFAFEIATRDRNYLCVASFKDELDGWLDAIRRVSDGSHASGIEHLTFQQVQATNSNGASAGTAVTNGSLDISDLLAQGEKILGSDSEEEEAPKSDSAAVAEVAPRPVAPPRNTSLNKHDLQAVAVREKLAQMGPPSPSTLKAPEVDAILAASVEEPAEGASSSNPFETISTMLTKVSGSLDESAPSSETATLGASAPACIDSRASIAPSSAAMDEMNSLLQSL